MLIQSCCNKYNNKLPTHGSGGFRSSKLAHIVLVQNLPYAITDIYLVIVYKLFVLLPIILAEFICGELYWRLNFQKVLSVSNSENELQKIAMATDTYIFIKFTETDVVQYSLLKRKSLY